jgi:AraC-like DNA-binding protein
MLLRRQPQPALQPLVRSLWASERIAPAAAGGERERVLPTGAMHLALRLDERPFRFFDDDTDFLGRAPGPGVVGGARAAPYLKDVAGPALSVGAELVPGACEALFGAPADELSGRHTALEDLWGPRTVGEARERLQEAGSVGRRLDVLESLLAARLPRLRGLHPAVAHALERLAAAAHVGEIVRETGASHRHLVALFRRAVGLSPKLYSRILRFQSALHRLAADRAAPQVEVALDSGYSDQAHFARDFRALAGITPGDHRALAPAHPVHVPATTPRAPSRGAVRGQPIPGSAAGWPLR